MLKYARTFAALIGLIALTLFLKQSTSLGITRTGRSVRVSSTQQRIETDLASTAHTPHKLKIGKDKFVYLHVGKAGGGTVRHHLNTFWELEFKECHPWPCPRWVINPEGNPAIALSVRDPIDRFVSAFYYTAKSLRGKCLMKKACSDDAYMPELTAVQVIFDKHKENVNSLAEALCDDTPSSWGGGLDSSKAAREDVKVIEHAAWSLVNWTEGIDWSLLSPHIFPLVQEPGFSFESEIDAMIEWTQDHSTFDTPSVFPARREVAKKRQQKTSNSNAKRHSSKSASKTPLSSRGEECLAHYFANDYKLLQQEILSSCKTEVCKKALNQMLARRANLLGH